MKLRRIIMFIIVISVIVIFLDCISDYGFWLLINGSKKEEISFNNNKIEISATSIAKITYTIIINYNLESDITIHTDAVNIDYKGKTIDNYYFNAEEKEIKDKNYTLKGSGILFLDFRILGDKQQEIVELGDTIKITAPDFITYNGDTLSVGELILVVGNRVEDKD